MPARADQPNPIASDPSRAAHDEPVWIVVAIAPAFQSRLDADHLERLAKFALRAEGRDAPLELGITITDDQEIHALNKRYLAHDYPTDVLAFSGGLGPAPTAATDDGGAPGGTEPGTAAATEYVTEGYEGDVEESGADQPFAEDAGAATDAGAGGGDAAGEAGPGRGAGLANPQGDAAAGARRADAPAVAFVTPPGWPSYLGDIVISYDTAAAQARDYGHGAAEEVDVLLVHGLLHLLGYDDHAPAERARMHARQDALVAAFARGA